MKNPKTSCLQFTFSQIFKNNFSFGSICFVLKCLRNVGFHLQERVAVHRQRSSIIYYLFSKSYSRERSARVWIRGFFLFILRWMVAFEKLRNDVSMFLCAHQALCWHKFPLGQFKSNSLQNHVWNGIIIIADAAAFVVQINWNFIVIYHSFFLHTLSLSFLCAWFVWGCSMVSVVG